MKIESKLHKQINGNIEGMLFNVVFDPDGRADVEEAVGEYLLRLRAVEKAEIKKSLAEIINEKLEEMEFSPTRGIFPGEAKDSPIPQIIKEEHIGTIEPKNLSDMSLSELKTEASRLNIKIGVGKTKNQIIALIEGAK